MSRRALAVVSVAIGALLGLSGSAQALSLAPPPADVVFSNGGRILSMKADGSERQVLFGKGREPKNDEMGAVDPVASPDRETVAFGFRREVRGRTMTDIWRVGTDGLGAKRLLVSKPRRSYGDPTFTWDGDLVVAYFEQRAGHTRTGLVRVGLDGRILLKLFELKEKLRPYRQSTTITGPDLADQGRKVLYVSVKGSDGDFSDEGFENDLWVRNLVTDRTRKIAGSVYEASWSGRGDKVVYSRQNPDDDLNICWWNSGCDFQSSLETANADGSGRQVLTDPKLDARAPDWSKDNRIVFQSARNLPSVGEANEIYSIKPDGGCLTMLTNGSPASLMPSWADGSDSSTSAGACGVEPSAPTVEVIPVARSFPGSYWLGQRFTSRLLTDSVTERSGSVYFYLDCDREQRGDCRPPVLLVTGGVCQMRGQFAELGSGFLRNQRGVPVFIDRGSEMGPSVSVIAGRSVVYFYGGTGKGKNRGRLEVDGLRPVGEELEPGGLAPVKIPAHDLKLMKKVKRTYSSSGSVPATARRLGMRPTRVRANLRFSRVIGKFGEYEKVNCRQ